MIREAREEAAITIKKEDLEVVQVMHRKSTDNERIDFFLACRAWEGDIKNLEKDKCDDLSWFNIDQLPVNTIPYIKFAIENYKNRVNFSEFNI